MKKENIKWRFGEVGVDDSVNDPQDDVYFKGTDKSEAIVREFIQNALDAQREDADQVKVTIKIGRQQTEDMSEFIGKLDSHLDWSGFKHDQHTFPEHRYMVVEDFGTQGLTGEYVKQEVGKDSKSRFFSFWWEKGQSDKSGSTIGSWGLGKTTNHMASEIKSFWGLTIRDTDKKEILMGKSMLSPHYSDDETHYQADGRFRRDDELGTPVLEQDVIEDFRETFPLERSRDDPGFSIIIPYLDQNIDYESIIKSSIIHYSFAIMLGDLEVEVIKVDAEGDRVDKTEITEDNIDEVAKEMTWNDLSWEDRDVSSTLDFCRDATSQFKNDDLLELEGITDIEQIKERDDFEDIKKQFNEGEIKGFKIPVTLEPDGEDLIETSFAVIIEKYPDEGVDPDEFYVREGILLPDESSRSLRTRSVRGVLLAYGDDISDFLSGAEEPAHEKWNERMDEYKDEYENAPSTLRFIRNSLSDLIVNLDETEERTLEGVLDIFAVPTEEISELEDKGNDNDEDDNTDDGDGGPGEDGPGKDIEPTKEKVNLSQTDQGFKADAVAEAEEYPQERRIRVAYDSESSDAFKAHSKYDFDLEEDISIDKKDVEIIETGLNSIKFSLKSEDAYIEFSGFDKNRDLRIGMNTI
jgi:hypothetical protein